MEKDVRTTVTEATVVYIPKDPIIEQVAAGLRAMNQKPDAFLWCGDDAWDRPDILGIPVFHSEAVMNTFTDDPVPLIPIWSAERDYWMSRRRFNEGFMEVSVTHSPMR